MRKKLLIFFLLSISLTFAQDITGLTKTGDKYSSMIRKSIEGYFKNDFTVHEEITADDAVFTINRETFSKDEIKAGFSAHHQLYSNINAPWVFVETTFYDENNNNQVWTHEWQMWEGTSKRNGEKSRGPVHSSFKWVDGKVVEGIYIYDSVPLSTEIAAVQKKKKK